jgi:hypothetical protein
METTVAIQYSLRLSSAVLVPPPHPFLRARRGSQAACGLVSLPGGKPLKYTINRKRVEKYIKENQKNNRKIHRNGRQEHKEKGRRREEREK